MSRLWRSPLWWAVAATAARHAAGAWQLRRTLAYLDSRPADPPADPDGALGSVTLHMVVPVLWEQQHVGPALRWFGDLLAQLPGSTLTVVSSSREDRERTVLLDQLTADPARPVTAARFPHLDDTILKQLQAAQQAGVLTRPAAAAVLERMPGTGEVVAALLAGGAFDSTRIRHVRYDGPGRKAAQVNAAVARLTGAGDRDFIAVYDVDSRPDPALLQRTAGFIAHRAAVDGELPCVVQQSARFVTAGTAGRGWQRAVCRGGARLQTLWTLRREIPSFRRYAHVTRQDRPMLGVLRRGLAQTVGHGLLIRRDILLRTGGLPEFTTLDDLPFGFRLTVDNIPVDVVPALATAAAPEHPRDLVGQQRRWFANYLDYPACAAAARAERAGTPAGRAGALSVAAYRGAAWAFVSAATVACTVAVVTPRTPARVRAVAAAALWLGCVTPTRMLAAHDRRTGGGQVPAGLLRQAAACGEVYAAYLLRSAGPLAALSTAVHRRPVALSPKTHHRADLEEPR